MNTSITKTRLNQSQKRDKKSCKQCQSIGLIPTTQQLSLFTDLEPPQPNNELPAYALQIGYIPHNKRVKPDKLCKLIHYPSGLTIKGQFTIDEAQKILETTRHWDWELDKHKIPRCAEKLLFLLENICGSYQDLGEVQK